MEKQENRQQNLAVIDAPAVNQDAPPLAYGILCSHFIVKASLIYGALPAFHKETAVNGGLDVMEAEQLAYLARQAQKEHDAVIERFKTRAGGWNFLASALPLQFVRQHCAGKRDFLIVEHADRTTEYLTPQIGKIRVAQLLPCELHTEEAAVFMRTQQRHALESVIHTALALR